MADLEIQAQPRQLVGTTVQPLKESPVSEQIQQSAEQTQTLLDRAAALLIGINKQKEAEANANGLAFYQQGSLELAKHTSQITDFDAKRKANEEGLNNLVDEAQKRFPGMSSIGIDQLRARSAVSQKDFYLKSIADEHAQQKASLIAYIKNQAQIAGIVNNNDRIAVADHTVTHIDQSAKNGLISKDEADWYSGDFLHGVALQTAYNAIAKGAAGDNDSLDQILHMQPGDPNTGLTSREIATLHENALHVYNQNLLLNHQKWQQKVDQAEGFASAHPERANEVVSYIGQPKATAYAGKGNPDPKHTNDLIDHFKKLTDLDEFNTQMEYMEQGVLPMMYAGDQKAFRTAAAAAKTKLLEQAKSSRALLIRQFKVHATELNPLKGIPNVEVFTQPYINQYYDTLSRLTHNLEVGHEKDYSKIADEANAEMDKAHIRYFSAFSNLTPKGTVPVAPTPAAASTPTATPAPAPTEIPAPAPIVPAGSETHMKPMTSETDELK